jgi:hypothetical protein
MEILVVSQSLLVDAMGVPMVMSKEMRDTRPIVKVGFH